MSEMSFGTDGGTRLARAEDLARMSAPAPQAAAPRPAPPAAPTASRAAKDPIGMVLEIAGSGSRIALDLGRLE